MALSRALARPFWTCRSCRANYIRSFTSAARNELPRHRPGRPNPSFVDVARSNLQDTEPLPEFDFDISHQQKAPPKKTSTEWNDARGEDEKLSQSPKKASRRRREEKVGKSDGISNHSNKVAAQDLSIPTEFLSSSEEAPQWQTERREPPQRRQAREAQPEQQAQSTAPTLAEKPMSSVPWYLQKEYAAPTRQNTSGPSQQTIPPLPTYPPPQLQPILEYLFTEGGLDDLKILDLRRLDPPPALGSNLIMVLGTARSAKHLVGTASRFCAHARRNWASIEPVADGLIGRNEMKIKEKRRARRAKAFANAGVEGAKASLENIDDGISTDWICVHVGRIDPDPEQPKKELMSVELERIGFGQESDKVSLVVQMFTEDKRETVGLERLWSGILERNLRKQAYRDGSLPLPGEEEEAERDGKEEQEEGEDDGSLTSQEKKARKRFKMGNKTVLSKKFEPWPELAEDTLEERATTS